MKPKLVFYWLFLIFFNPFENSQAQSKVPSDALKEITAGKFQAHIDFLASDALLGRNTPSAGLDTAAAYIVREFKKYGIQPVNGTYFNPLPLFVTSLGPDNYLEINHEGTIQSLSIKSQFVPFEHTANDQAEGILVFAGYGISAPEYDYDDYSGLDVTGKIVLVMQHEPGEQDSASVFNGKGPTRYSSIDYKMQNAINHGAVGMLVVTDPLNHVMINPRGFPWPSLSKIIPEDILPVTLKLGPRKAIPMVHAGKELMIMLFGSVDSLQNLQAYMDKNMQPRSKEYTDIYIRMKTNTIETPVKTYNVIGLLPGSEPVLKNEFLIIGAHYDHVGFEGEYAGGEDYIYNGADDNASGTSGIILLAEAFSKSGQKPGRSVLFIAFSGEERGLYGSRSYVENPVVPLENTVAMINLDMISRNHPDSVEIRGNALSPDLTEIVEAENSEIGLKLDLSQTHSLGGSDHISFYDKGIPFINFYTGTHDDYHTVRDNPDRVDAEKAARIIRLAFRTAWNIASDNRRYEVIKE